MKSAFRRRRRSKMGVVLEYLSLIDIHLSGKASSLMCLCGLSVSLAFYVLYLRFYPQFYYSAFLKRIIKRLIQTSSQRHAYSISNRRKRTLSHTASLSINNDTNNNSKTSDTDTGVCSIGSVDSSRQDGILIGEFHQMPSSATSATAAAAAEMRMRHRIMRRRRTLSDSPDVIARLDDFICLIPEFVDQPRYNHRTRNVIDWLAQIDPETSLSWFDGDQLDDIESPSGRAQVQSPESTLSRSSTSCGCVHQSFDNWCQECLKDATAESDVGLTSRRFSGLTNSKVMSAERQDQGQSALHPEGEESELQQKTSFRAVSTVFRPSNDNWSMNNNSSTQGSMLEGTQECGSEVGKVKRSDKDERLDVSKPVFYFEDDFDDTSEKGILSQSVNFKASSGHSYLPDRLPRRGSYHLGSSESSSFDGPHFGGAKGHDWLRVRILGTGRKHRISTGSGVTAEFLASRYLQRNHHSFTSAISGASSDYTYRESLVSKGISVDCGEDLDDLVIPGDDLLEAAEFSRRTLTNIDQLHQELEVIQRNITYINQKVEVLQSREDLPSYSARYGYGVEESIVNEIPVLDAAAPGRIRRNRSKSLSLTPCDGDVQINTYSQIETVQHSTQAEGLIWDYGSDLALNPVYSHHRSLSGLAGEPHVSNQLRTRRSRSEEMERTFRRDLSPDDLSLSESDDDSEDDPEMTHFTQSPVRQHSDSICDEYFEDDYTILTHLHQ